MRILLVRTDRIGDVLLTTPAIGYLRQKMPEAKFSLLVSPQTKELVQGHPEIEEILVLDKRGRHRGLWGSYRFIRLLKKRGFDTALIFHPTVRVHLLLFLAGIPRRIGYRKKMGWFLTHWVKDQRHLGNQHEVDNVLDFIDQSRLGSTKASRSYRLWIASSEQADQRISKYLESFAVREEERLIAIHPGAGCPSKQWPLERFVEVAKGFGAQGYRVIFVGGKEDFRVREELSKCEVQDVRYKAVKEIIDLSGQTTLLELSSLLRRCRLLISNDSGPVHVAVASGTPALSIFGRNQRGLSPTRWRPLGPNDRYLHKDVGCYVCLAHRCNLGFECLGAISVEEVATAAKEMLAKLK